MMARGRGSVYILAWGRAVCESWELWGVLGAEEKKSRMLFLCGFMAGGDAYME